MFGADSTNEELTSSEISPMLDLANSGGNGTILCFGQTGTGKTYTLQSCVQFLIKKLSEQIYYNGKSASELASQGEDTNLSITFYEVFGKKCHDLLNGRKGSETACRC